jgi:hypothetical protein
MSFGVWGNFLERNLLVFSLFSFSSGNDIGKRIYLKYLLGFSILYHIVFYFNTTFNSFSTCILEISCLQILNNFTIPSQWIFVLVLTSHTRASTSTRVFFVKTYSTTPSRITPLFSAHQYRSSELEAIYSKLYLGMLSSARL